MAIVILGAALPLLAVLAVLAGRHSILRVAGRALVTDDPIRPADAIVIAVDAGGAGVLEAADLVQSGISRRVAVFAELPDAVDLEFSRRRVAYENEVTRKTRELRALGVDRIEQIPIRVAGSEDEGRVLPAWCDEQQLRSVVVVTSADHTRRLRRVLHRAMKGHRTQVMVRRARHSEFDPDQWWWKRGGIRTEIVEIEKLLLDVVRHPIS